MSCYVQWISTCLVQITLITKIYIGVPKYAHRNSTNKDIIIHNKKKGPEIQGALPAVIQTRAWQPKQMPTGAAKVF